MPDGITTVTDANGVLTTMGGAGAIMYMYKNTGGTM